MRTYCQTQSSDPDLLHRPRLNNYYPIISKFGPRYKKPVKKCGDMMLIFKFQ